MSSAATRATSLACRAPSAAATLDQDMVCMANTWLVSLIASLSLVCVMLSGLIVTWSCQSMRQPRKSLPM